MLGIWDKLKIYISREISGYKPVPPVPTLLW